MRVRRSVAVFMGLAMLSACAGNGAQESAPTAQDAAAGLAAAMSKGSLDGIAIRQGNPAEELPVLLRGMNGLLPQVTVSHVSPSAQVANIKLGYSWPLSSPWTYEADAVMVLEGTEWQLNWEPTVLHPKLTPTSRLERQRGEASERGNITGRGNAVLVESTPMQMLGLNKAGLDPATVADSARKVADKTDVDPEAFLAKAQAAGADAFVDAAPFRPTELPADFLAIKGAGMRTVTLPAPKTSGYARALLGTIGYATEEQAQEAGSNVAPGDLVGVGGLQRTYDKDLRGSTGNRVFLADREAPMGSQRPTNATLLADFPDVPGQALETTIDDGVQTAAEQALTNVKVPASVVVLRVGNGAILAAADSPEARRRDDSTMGQFPPGLAASPVTALALMRSGVNLNDSVACDKTVNVAGRTFENDKNYSGRTGQITLQRAISSECITAVAAASERLDPAKLPEAAKSLGVGEALDIGVPTFMGEFTAPGDAVARAEGLTGQGGGGQLRASALSLATMAASVQAKQPVSPFLVPGREPKIEGAVPLSDDEAKALQDLMKAGAGSHRPLTAVSTGTSGGRVWAVGYSDAYAVAVVMTDDDKTSVTPAQIVRAASTTAR